MKKLIESIKNIKPACEQEKEDKEVILSQLSESDNALLYRSSKVCHFTSSAFVFNQDGDKLLIVHHNIYNTWAFIGGHADGENDLLSVAIREVTEESGLNHVVPLWNDIKSIDILTTSAHYRKGVYVPSHLHFNVSYIVTGDEKEPVSIKPDENSDVKWIKVSEIDTYITEPEMKHIFKKIIDDLSES